MRVFVGHKYFVPKSVEICNFEPTEAVSEDVVACYWTEPTAWVLWKKGDSDGSGLFDIQMVDRVN